MRLGMASRHYHEERTNDKERWGDAMKDLNTNLPDLESDVTSYGAHNRLIVFADVHEPLVTIREDRQGLPMSTETQRMKVANSWQRMHPRWAILTLRNVTEYNNSVFYDYDY